MPTKKSVLVIQQAGLLRRFNKPPIFQRYQHIAKGLAEVRSLALHGGHPRIDKNLFAYSKIQENLVTAYPPSPATLAFGTLRSPGGRGEKTRKFVVFGEKICFFFPFSFPFERGQGDGRQLPKLNEYTAWYDVAILPFVKNAVTDTVSPVKIFEYMAAGKPIVSTDLLEYQKYQSCLIARNKTEFLDKLETALLYRQDTSHHAALAAEAQANSWRKKAQQILLLTGIEQ